MMRRDWNTEISLCLKTLKNLKDRKFNKLDQVSTQLEAFKPLFNCSPSISWPTTNWLLSFEVKVETEIGEFYQNTFKMKRMKQVWAHTDLCICPLHI